LFFFIELQEDPISMDRINRIKIFFDRSFIRI